MIIAAMPFLNELDLLEIKCRELAAGESRDKATRRLRVDTRAKSTMAPLFAVVSGQALLHSLLTLIAVGVIFWGLWRLIALVTMQPLNQILKIIWVVLVVLFAVDFLTGFVGVISAPLIRL